MVNAYDSETEPARDDVPLHLRSAGVQRAPYGVTERSLHLVLRHVTVSTVDLDCGSSAVRTRDSLTKSLAIAASWIPSGCARGAKLPGTPRGEQLPGVPSCPRSCGRRLET